MRLIQALFLFFRNALNKVNETGLQLSFNVLLNPLTFHAKKTNYITLKTIDSEISLIVALAEKGMGIVSTFMILQDKCFS